MMLDHVDPGPDAASVDSQAIGHRTLGPHERKQIAAGGRHAPSRAGPNSEPRLSHQVGQRLPGDGDVVELPGIDAAGL
jgi:hypothetical protein